MNRLNKLLCITVAVLLCVTGAWAEGEEKKAGGGAIKQIDEMIAKADVSKELTRSGARI